MTKEILSSLQIPDSCKIDKKLYKKQFLENYTLKSDEKKVLKNDVESIKLAYLLNENNINIEAVVNADIDYSEVAFIEVVLLDDKHCKKISKIIQNIPYALVVVLHYGGSFCMNISPKRVNQQDNTKLLVYEEYFTPWIDGKNINEKEKAFIKSLEIQNQSFVNFERFYHDMLDKLIAFNLSKDRKTLITPRATNKESLDTIAILEEQIKELQRKMQKETHFNDKVDLNVKLKVLYDKLDKIKGELCKN